MKRLAITLLMGLVVLGCGDSDPQPTEPLTQAAYSAQGNAICEQMNADLDALSIQVAAGVSPEEERDLFVEANRVSSGAIAALFELTPPASLVDDRQSMLDLVEARRQLIQRMGNGEDLSEQLLAVNQQFEDEARSIWPSCTT